MLCVLTLPASLPLIPSQFAILRLKTQPSCVEFRCAYVRQFCCRFLELEVCTNSSNHRASDSGADDDDLGVLLLRSMCRPALCEALFGVTPLP